MEIRLEWLLGRRPLGRSPMNAFSSSNFRSNTNLKGMNRTFEWRAAIAVMWVRSNHQSDTTQAGKYQPFEWDSGLPAR